MAAKADKVTRDELLTDEERAAEAAEAEKYEQQAATPKRGAKAAKAKPEQRRCHGCGSVGGDDERLCYECREVWSNLATKLTVEAFVQGHQVKAGVALAFDWADEVLVERWRRVQARTGRAQ